jgi:hypothetical protein
VSVLTLAKAGLVTAGLESPCKNPALSLLGERVGRLGVFFSRGGPGEGVPAMLPVVRNYAGRDAGSLSLDELGFPGQYDCKE